MLRFLRPLTRRVTYTRWLHLLISTLVIGVWLFITEDALYVPVIALALLGFLPAMRLVEGLQARLLLSPYGYKDDASGIAVSSSTTWADRWRTVLWLELRLGLGMLTGRATVHLLGLSFDLALQAGGGSADSGSLVPLPAGDGHWWYALLVPVPIALLLACVVGLGELIAFLARRLLGPSAAERLAALEERTEQLLERNRIARELHDSIGHALTVAVVQAGAARAAGNAEFTERALSAIEETGRSALEDLERVLLVLRESGQPVGSRPTLADADRLLESARASGAEVDAEVTGPLTQVPGPVSREGYRIVQEALTNVLRHAGPVPTRVRIAVADGRLELEVHSALAGPVAPVATGSRGSGLRGIRERAALLGGEATTGPHEGRWRVRVGLPLDGLR
ncbi:two-component sensor histidine kinase [Streptomyces sp. PKU-EA00015]|uniref:sensor histidine kinase n=1 Tax=Streptomyces sp. PKU-EA00015 TaxID=2748326 RepID=UPI0015A235DA|nr:histidine kinase [Streptomyces sp. PKU-EA00015]NWF28449.1 two-component sensor histidine kinase [Streptomyces sp. PKU-EA00015]